MIRLWFVVELDKNVFDTPVVLFFNTNKKDYVYTIQPLSEQFFCNHQDNMWRDAKSVPEFKVLRLNNNENGKSRFIIVTKKADPLGIRLKSLKPRKIRIIHLLTHNDIISIYEIQIRVI